MNSNFKKSWSFWGGRKRFDHKFNSSFENEFEGPRVCLEDRFQNPTYDRNQFQTRSLRFDRRNIIQPSDYQCLNASVNDELDARHRAHSQWSKNLQRSLGYQTIHSPVQPPRFRGNGSAQHSNMEPRRPPLLNTPGTPKMFHGSQNVPEPIYENMQVFMNDIRPPLLPTPMDSPSIRPLHYPAEEDMDMTPELPPRNSKQMHMIGPPLQEHVINKGGARINKAFQGVCTSMRTFSQRFRKKTKRHYQLDSSPCTPRVTPAKNLYPFDLNTPMTPHSYKRGTKRLQGSARRQLLGKENLGIARTPNHLHNTRANWASFSPMHLPDARYRPN